MVRNETREELGGQLFSGKSCFSNAWVTGLLYTLKIIEDTTELLLICLISTDTYYETKTNIF